MVGKPGAKEKMDDDEITLKKQKREMTLLESFPASQLIDRSLLIAPSYSYYDFHPVARNHDGRLNALHFQPFGINDEKNTSVVTPFKFLSEDFNSFVLISQVLSPGSGFYSRPFISHLVISSH